MMNWIIGLCFTLGLALAGSDGAWFPWPNIVGLAIFSVVPIAANRMEA